MVVRPTDKRGVELARVDTDEARLEAAIEELPRQRVGRPAPKWKKAFEPERRKALLSIPTHVLEKEITVRDAPYRRLAAAQIAERARHRRVVQRVRAPRLDRYLDEGEPK